MEVQPTSSVRETRQGRFGNLLIDVDAAEKRHVMKFFDSAEWAMRNRDDGAQPQETRMQLPFPTVDEIKKQSDLRMCFERSPLVV